LKAVARTPSGEGDESVEEERKGMVGSPSVFLLREIGLYSMILAKKRNRKRKHPIPLCLLVAKHFP
jgi:hypothetical protein